MIREFICRIGIHKFKHHECESGYKYPVCVWCGKWECWDGHIYEKKHWPPPYPGFSGLYRSWREERGLKCEEYNPHESPSVVRVGSQQGRSAFRVANVRRR